MPINIGIDLGTTNSCISYLEGKEAMIIPNPEGARVIPTLVALNREGKRIFGNVAKRQLITNSKNTVWGIKRLMGRKFDSPEVKEMRKRVGYQINKAESGDVQVQLGENNHSPEEISGMFLNYLKGIAEVYLGEAVGDTVITVPAFFNDAQRQATKVAGEIAGLHIARIINEPTAALIAYGKKIHRNGLYGVYDLGGGTFDISIVEVNGDVYKVVSTLGDTFLGGGDFDAQITNWIFHEVESETALDLRDNRELLQRVIQIAEKAKIELSFNLETLISIPYLYHFPDGTNYHFQKKLTRSQLESFTVEFIDKTIELIKKSLDDINVTPSQLEKIILVGGQSRMPLVAQKLKEFFYREPAIDVNPEEVVAQGAVIQAEIIKGRVSDLLLLDVTPLSLGVETKGGTFTKIIERNSTIPIKKSMAFTTISDNQTTVKIHMLQGEREVAQQNKSLGYFNLIGIPLAPKGIPQIEVSFEIDANGIVQVSARDKQTGMSQSMKVHPASGISPEEIKKVIAEAKQYEEEDKKTVKLNKIKMQLKEELDTAKFFYNRYAEKLSAQGKVEIDTLMAKTEEVLESDDLDTLENLLKKMQAFRIKINSILFSEFDR